MSNKSLLDAALDAESKGWKELAQDLLRDLALQLFHNSTTKIIIHSRNYITYIVLGNPDEHPLPSFWYLTAST